MGGRTVFTRVSGGIVLDSFSIVSLFTGILAALPAGLLLLIGSSGPRSAGVGAAVFVVWGLTVLVFVSRFAQLGIAGDSEGGLFSETAGPWSGTFLAAARLLVLWAVWVLPFVAWAFLKSEPQAPPAGFPGIGFALLAAPRIPILLAFWSALGMVLSFGFVAVSVAAPGFGDIFSPGLWRTLFAGRLGELFVAVAGTYGPPVTVLALVLPFIAALVPLNPKAALTGMIPFVLTAVGMVLTLQGKLCGAFAAASLVEEGEMAAAFEAVPSAEAPALAAAVPGPVHTAAPAPAETPGPVLGDPKHLHAVWQSQLSAGDSEEALQVAREAIPAGLAKKEPRLAAEIYRRHLDRLPELGLDRTALDLLADQLLRDGDVAAAAWTFSQALDTEPTDPKAFKGLLRVAEHHLDKAKEPLEAIRVYRYLLERAPASPFADHARDLLGAAERRAARPATPQG
jgi:TolA-binding protein